MLNRRKFLVGCAAALYALDHAESVQSEGDGASLPDGSMAKGMITPPTQEAIDQGLAYLARRQRPDGSFGTNHHERSVAITSLGALAFMAGGHQPGRGLYGTAVTRALDFVLASEDSRKPGFLHSHHVTYQHDGAMYHHGFATLFLAELHGMVQQRELRKRVHETLKNAVNVIVNGQNIRGGWRYNPDKKEADISVTVCQMMALRAARNAGVAVPRETVDLCIKYAHSCQEGPGSQHAGGFRYMAQGGPPAFARTAAGVMCLYCAGVYKDRAIDSGLKYLMKYKPGPYFSQPDLHYFYGHYYAVQAMWNAGGAYWSEWYPAIRDELIGRAHRHRPDGAWMDRICQHYATAMACIILQVPNNYLPILQK
jgi:hypothetical protein